MAWVRGIREVRNVEVLVREESQARRGQVGRNPGVVREQRVITDLTAEGIVQTLRYPIRFRHLPEHTGAGPCGTYARRTCGRSLAWSIEHLLEPLAQWYATYVPPMHFGAKTGPRGRRVA